MTANSRIAKRRSDMSELYRPLYDRVVAGTASPRQAIKSFCLQCMGWQRKDVATCKTAECSLHRHRPYQQERPAPRREGTAGTPESPNADQVGVRGSLVQEGHSDG